MCLRLRHRQADHGFESESSQDEASEQENKHNKYSAPALREDATAASLQQQSTTGQTFIDTVWHPIRILRYAAIND